MEINLSKLMKKELVKNQTERCKNIFFSSKNFLEGN